MKSSLKLFFPMLLLFLSCFTIVIAQQVQYVKQDSNIIYAGNGNSVIACNISTGDTTTIVTLPNKDGCSILSMSEDGKSLFVGSWGGAVYKINVGSRSNLITGSTQLLQPSSYGTNITGLVSKASGNTLYACGQNYVYKIDVSRIPWKVTQLAKLIGPAQIITTCLTEGDSGLYLGYTTAANAFGSQIVFIGKNTPAKSKNLYNGIDIGMPHEIVICPNGNLLVSTNRNLFLLSKSLVNLASVPIPGGTPNGLVISSDGATAYVATYNQEEKWNWYYRGNLIRVNVTANTLTIIDTFSFGTKFPAGLSVLDKSKKAFVGIVNSLADGTISNYVSIINLSGSEPSISDTIKLAPGPVFIQAVLSSIALRETNLDFSEDIRNLNNVVVNSAINTVYVTGSLENRIKVIDGTTNVVDTTLRRRILDLPNAIAVNSRTNTIYVANQGNDDVTVFNGNNYAIIDSVTVGKSPTEIAVNPVTNKIYVANYHGNSLTVINGTTNDVDTTLAMGSYPTGIAIDTLSNKIFWLNINSRSVVVLDGTSYSIDTSVTVLTTPICIAVNSSTNKIYVGQYNRTDGLGGYFLPNEPRYSVRVIDSRTYATDTVLYMAAEPTCIAINPITNAVYTGIWNKNLTVIDDSSYAMKTIYLPPGTLAKNLAVNPLMNKIYVVNSASPVLTIVEE